MTKLTMETTNRKIFNYDNQTESKIVDMTKKTELYENSVSAGGCLFYKEINNKKKLLLIKYEHPAWPRLDDFGGVIDNTDDTLENAIIREVLEESNFIITEKIMKHIFKNKKYIQFYNKQSKYTNILVKVEDDFFLDTTVFGTVETTDNINRTVSWYDYDECKELLAFRIYKNKELMDFLNKKIE
jgi:hypothetical protein